MAEYGDVIKQRLKEAWGYRCGVDTAFLTEEIMGDVTKVRYRCMAFIKRTEDAQDFALCQAVKKFAKEHSIDILEISDKEIIDVIAKLRPEKPKDDRYCGKCWVNLRKTDNYCPNCGTRIDWGE